MAERIIKTAGGDVNNRSGEEMLFDGFEASGHEDTAAGFPRAEVEAASHTDELLDAARESTIGPDTVEPPVSPIRVAGAIREIKGRAAESSPDLLPTDRNHREPIDGLASEFGPAVSPGVLAALQQSPTALPPEIRT